jgi:hypothetical protein
MSKFHRVALSGANAVLIKAGSGTITSYEIFNNAPGWYPVFVKFHDINSVPTAGVGVVRTIGVQAGLQAESQAFIAFDNGIAMTIVKGIDDADATPVLAEDCVVSISYV